jgi:hypothetical protein
MPKVQAVPESLRPFAQLQAVAVDDAGRHFGEDIEQYIVE